MADEADIYRLFLGAPDAQAQAQAMADALRRRREGASLQRNIGNLGLLTGDKVLANYGQAQLQQAGQEVGEVGRGEGMLAQAGSQLAGRQLQEALAKRAQSFEAGQQTQRLGAQRELAGITDAREREKMGAEAERARMKVADDKAKALQNLSEGMRKEFNADPEVKAYRQIRGNYDALTSSAQGGPGASDLAIIFNYMKMLDPGVAVMEGDVRNVTNTSGQMDAAINDFRRISGGGFLSDKQRKDILRQAKTLHEAAQKRYTAREDDYLQLAERSGASPGDVVLRRLGTSAPAAPATPAAPSQAPGSINLDTAQAAPAAEGEETPPKTILGTFRQPNGKLRIIYSDQSEEER